MWSMPTRARLGRNLEKTIRMARPTGWQGHSDRVRNNTGPLVQRLVPGATSARGGEEGSQTRSFSGYHGLKSAQQFAKQEWTGEAENLTEERLDIDGHPVMQKWESNYMAALAEIACSQGGRVLEVGFGMAISASAVQKHNITEHIIMEANGDVYKRLEKFAVKHPNVTPMGPALWQDSIKNIPDNSIDGILYDTYPLNAEEQHIHQFEFLKEARRILKPGGILTYCNLTSIGVLKNDYPDSWDKMFEETQLDHILNAGYLAEEIAKPVVVPVNPPDWCEYYSHKTALAPILVKSGAQTKSTYNIKKGNFTGRRHFSSSSGSGRDFSTAKNTSRTFGSTAVGTNNTAKNKNQSKASKKKSKSGKRLMTGYAAQAFAAAPHMPEEQLEYPQVGLMPNQFVEQNNHKVNAWTQWGDLEMIMVGHANYACFPPPSPSFQPSINDPKLADYFEWPEGRKAQQVTDRANAELDNLSAVLEAEGITVVRPGSPDWRAPIKTPYFEMDNQYCHTCVRDSLITVGNIIMEAPMSRRDRYFENLAFRDVVRHLWDSDPSMLWKSAPRPRLDDESYDNDWWLQSDEDRFKNMHDYQFCITERDVLFDAADIMRAGKDIFVQHSMTCNQSGIEWLRRELAPHGVRVHTVRFPYDLAPSHLDCTFQLLKPGLVLTNPERPIAEDDAAIFKRNGWQFVDAPQPNNPERPAFSQSSKWLSMNILSIGRDTMVVEEEEVNTQNMLKDLGFRVLPVPFRGVYEFGGSLHCATWDIRRKDSMDDFFPNQ